MLTKNSERKILAWGNFVENYAKRMVSGAINEQQMCSQNDLLQESDADGKCSCLDIICRSGDGRKIKLVYGSIVCSCCRLARLLYTKLNYMKIESDSQSRIV